MFTGLLLGLALFGAQSVPPDSGKAKPRQELPSSAKPAPLRGFTDPKAEKQKPKSPPKPLGEPKLKRRKNP